MHKNYRLICSDPFCKLNLLFMSQFYFSDVIKHVKSQFWSVNGPIIVLN